MCVQRWHEDNAKRPILRANNLTISLTPRRRSTSNSSLITSASRDPYTGQSAQLVVKGTRSRIPGSEHMAVAKKQTATGWCSYGPLPH
jgi:hypothetical protein